METGTVCGIVRAMRLELLFENDMRACLQR